MATVSDEDCICIISNGQLKTVLMPKDKSDDLYSKASFRCSRIRHRRNDYPEFEEESSFSTEI